MATAKTKLFNHASWTKKANIYEVNLRQYSQEGTINAFAKDLPRLKKMGVDILWIMPIQPIGVQNRKGGLGSNYSVSDYKAVNPFFGTMDDFKELVKKVHAAGMYIIIDWVANHTAWDHVWVTEHPEWYKKNEQGEIHSYIYDNGHELEYWTDVVGLDYNQPALWDAMTEALTYWIKEADIDGYRCDVAGLVPTAFWEQARDEMEKIKPIFMLAEWSTTELHRKAFDMTYDWELYDLMTEIMQKKATCLKLKKWVEQPANPYPADAYRMKFTTNHDLNSWKAHDVELYGAAFKACAVLAATLPGMPLVYNGQESGLGKRLAFFDTDPIDWKDYAYTEFYKELLKLKKKNAALWNGQYGGDIKVLPATSQTVFAFKRTKGSNSVTVVINFSARAKKIAASDDLPELALPAWGYQILVND
jgi:glycosidase